MIKVKKCASWYKMSDINGSKYVFSHIKPTINLWSVRHTINAALTLFCGCLQMIATAINTVSTIREAQSKLHHLRACRELAALEMKMLRAMTEKTAVRIKVQKFNCSENHLYSNCNFRISLTSKNSRKRHIF